MTAHTKYQLLVGSGRRRRLERLILPQSFEGNASGCRTIVRILVLRSSGDKSTGSACAMFEPSSFWGIQNRNKTPAHASASKNQKKTRHDNAAGRVPSFLGVSFTQRRGDASGSSIAGTSPSFLLLSLMLVLLSVRVMEP